MVSTNDKTLRLPKTQKAYVKYLEDGYMGHCIFCAKDLLVKEFEYWILVKNKFPYDKIYFDHKMLAPKRHLEELCDLRRDELEEMQLILDSTEHNQAILNKKQYRSVPLHFHLHLVTIK